MSDKPRYWMSPPPVSCELIGFVETRHDDINTSGEFVDGRTALGSWACMCMPCHRKYGMGLGTGKGQRYTRQADGRWLKTGG